jgi:metal-responsive CopG/Arc/MetJ family transcriptional regulator
MGTKVKVSVTIERELLREVERLSDRKSRSEVFEHALSAWVRNRARVALDHAIEAYYRAQSAEEREEDERWAHLGDDAVRKGWRD